LQNTTPYQQCAKTTYLNELVPTSGDDGWLFWIWGESDGRNPVRVTLVGFVGELAVTNGVPDLDGSVTASRDDLSVVWGERDRQNVTGVANESLEGGAVGKVPKTKGLVPRSRDGESTVLGDGDVLDNVRVALKSSLWDAVSLVVSGQVPDDDALVTGTGQKNVWVRSGGGKGGDPAVVTLKGSSKDENFVLAHFDYNWYTRKRV
jgi:hypothetical protein